MSAVNSLTKLKILLDFSALKLTFSGGSTLTSATAEIWRETTGCSVTEGYGLSESSAVVCLNEPGKEHLGSVGRPTAGTQVELWDDNDTPVADGQSGQVVVRGPQIMSGYWNMPEETQKVMSAEGFFKTGDVGVRLPATCDPANVRSVQSVLSITRKQSRN